MAEIDFHRIAARCGSQSNAFEELCCQLARRIYPTTVSFERFRGAGGDGGVECIASRTGGAVTGWQAKFVFSVEALIAQANESLLTALSIHKDLRTYVVCFPFDPTGKTGRTTKKGRPATSESEKLAAWVAKTTKEAEKKGRDLTIELWPASKLQSLLLEHDAAGGVRHYFFSETVLSDDWFRDHLITAAKAAGPRYTAALNVETALWRWFCAFGEGAEWRRDLDARLKTWRKAANYFRERVEEKTGGLAPKWPTSESQAGQDVIKMCDEVLRLAKELHAHPSGNAFSQLSTVLTNLSAALYQLELTLARELNAKHGDRSAESKRFRTFMAEHLVSFPAANLDAVRDALKEVDELANWLRSPTGYLAANRVFILSGAGGSGKTHGICDMAMKRLQQKEYTCILFGHQFGGEPAEWTRIVESLGLSPSLGKDCILDALNAAGEASGAPLIFCIDAVNETRPRNYWLNRFLSLAHEFQRRPFLKVCASCRTSFLSTCLPQPDPYPVIEHQGFAGIEREACNAFFRHYELDPPLVPILQPELSNPLYLKLVCETLKLKGLKQLPTGWFGLTPVINTFLSEKEKQFASEHGILPGAGIVSGSLLAIAAAIAQSGDTALRWSEAQRAVNIKRPQAATLHVLEWLVTAELVIEDGPIASGVIGGENVLRPAFERFGDFLIAVELVTNIAIDDFAKTFLSNASIQRLLTTPASVAANAGVVTALSVVVAETVGREIPDLIENRSVREAVLALTIRALPWRTPDSFSRSTGNLAREALMDEGWDTMDSLFSVCASKSALDAYWISDLLASVSTARRDGFWCDYLHNRYEENGIVRRLIDATRDIDLRSVDSETAARWALMLLWCTAAADRRVKDEATRGAIAIFRAKGDVIVPVVERLLDIDDDEVRERVLLCAYGSLVVTRDKKTLRSVAETVLTRFQFKPDAFQNAIIRDHIRCIGELAQRLDCLDKRFDPSITSNRQPDSVWPLPPPTEEELENWTKADGAVHYLARSCLYDDFNHYSIICLSPWMHQFDKQSIGGWILKHIVDEFDFDSGDFDYYDDHMVTKGGGGRSKPVWAERIGKKYQWIALYRLASRLHDKVDREDTPGTPKPVRTPLILMEERKLDPTLSRTTVPDGESSECWWIRANMNLAETKRLDFASWVAAKDDIPLLEALLQPTKRMDQRWIVLVAFPKWSEYQPDMPHGTQYRDAWMHVRSYLVPKSQFRKAINALEGRNYFGQWLPSGGKWLHAFAGEYPWATAFNSEPDWYMGAGKKVRGTALQLIHSSNEVVIEWEYDATLPSSVYIEVPTRELFHPGDLWWNGTSGFERSDGKTVFFDPILTDGRPPALLADLDDLLQRLDSIGYRLVWTMLGEKWILGGESSDSPRICYSQMAWLTDSGSVKVGNRQFFEDYSHNQGFNKS